MLNGKLGPYLTAWWKLPLIFAATACAAACGEKLPRSLPVEESAESESLTTDGASPAPSVMPIAPVDLPPFEAGVVLVIVTETKPNGSTIVRGETNLPDATRLLITVLGGHDEFSGQDDPTVYAGRFASAAFGNPGLRSGEYKAIVTMPVARVQPETVRSVIGTNGEKLRGKLVEISAVGRTVSLTIRFSIDGGSGPVEADPSRARMMDALLDSAAAYLNGRGGPNCAYRTVEFLDRVTRPLNARQVRMKDELENAHADKILANSARYGGSCSTR
jgi:hypothetical protein